jgi:hypothetical protein
MGESLPLSVLRRVAEAGSDAESARIVGANADAVFGRIVGAASGTVMARLSDAVPNAVEKAVWGAVADAVVVRVSVRVSARVSVADSALKCRGQANEWPRRHVSRPTEGACSHEKDTEGSVRVLSDAVAGASARVRRVASRHRGLRTRHGRPDRRPATKARSSRKGRGKASCCSGSAQEAESRALGTAQNAARVFVAKTSVPFAA